MSDLSLDNFLLQFAAFTPPQLALIRSQAVEKHFLAGAYFAEAGRVAQEIGFLVHGVLRVCYFGKDGREFTKYFLEENNFVVDLHSYQHRLPSTEYVQAVTDARLLVFSARAWQALGRSLPDWATTETRLITQALLNKVSRLSPLVQQDAATRYREFLEKFPGLANRIPLAYLASYIGVTPQSLSRIRKNSFRSPAG